MQPIEDLKSKNDQELEDWFLNAPAREPLPSESMLSAVALAAGRGDNARAEEWSEFLIDTLTAKGMAEGVLRALTLRCAWHADDAAFRAECRKRADGVLKDRLGQACVRNAGFDKAVPLPECLRRLGVLTNLKAGAMCHDKTWGFGVVQRVDDFYEKVTVDFTRKPGHVMSLAYASEALTLVGEEHLLALRHRKPDELRATIKTRPGEVVRIALRSYGPMSAPLLQELLTAEVLPEAEWKGFWDAARKQLKSDPLVHVPSKRNEEIRLLEKAKGFDADWFQTLADEKDVAAILRSVEEVARTDTSALSADVRRTLGERLAFAIWGCEHKRPEMLARLLMAAGALGCSGDLACASGGVDGGAIRVNTAERALALRKPSRFVDCATALPARDLARFIEYLSALDAGGTQSFLLSLLPQMTSELLDVVVPYLAAADREADCRAALTACVLERRATGDVLYWLCRNVASGAGWERLGRIELIAAAIEVLAWKEDLPTRRAKKKIRLLFEDKKWLGQVLEGLPAEQRVGLFAKVQKAAGWDASGKRSAMAAMIRLDPELAKVAASAEAEPETRPGTHFTSWRSYRERQEKLRILSEKTIPENSREIATARSYGDLSENFEYHAAKDRQRLLLKRRGELETDLEGIKGTDFSGMPTDKAGMGTCVTLQRPDGRSERYCILGEWDRDEALNIISYKSKIAECLEGRTAGEQVALPGPSGVEVCRITEVGGLTADVRNWIAGDATVTDAAAE